MFGRGKGGKVKGKVLREIMQLYRIVNHIVDYTEISGRGKGGKV